MHQKSYIAETKQSEKIIYRKFLPSKSRYSKQHRRMDNQPLQPRLKNKAQDLPAYKPYINYWTSHNTI